MKKWLQLLSLVLLLSLLVACQTAAPPTQSKPHDTFGLEVLGPTGTKVLSMADLKKLPAVEGYAGIKNSSGRITPPTRFKGVTLEELSKAVGGITPEQGLNVVAKDGYAMTFSYDQAIKGNLIRYDPGTGDEIQIDAPLQVILAYEQDGQPIPEDSDGPLRVVAISAKNNQVTDGHWSVKWVRQLVIKSMAEEWILHLEGVLIEEMDRATFESGGAPLCHRQSWTDADGHVWSGIPLWLLVGRVDDDVKHQTRAFSDKLAEAGYTADVIAADGYTVSFESTRLMHDNNLIVAHLMDEEPLESKYFPLRLVGPDLQKSEMVGQIAQIVMRMGAGAEATGAPPAQPTAEPVPLPAESNATLTFSGLVKEKTQFAWANLRAMGVVIQAEHPKKGLQTYEGARLNALLAKVGIEEGAVTVVITARDGYQAEVALSDVQACADCIVALDENGLFNTVLPGLPSSAWVKDVVEIALK